MTTQMFYSVPFQVVGIARNEVAYMQLWVFFFLMKTIKKKWCGLENRGFDCELQCEW